MGNLTESEKIKMALENAEKYFKEKPNEKIVTYDKVIVFNMSGDIIAFTKLDCVGNGAFGTVYVGYDKTGARFAIKAEFLPTKNLEQYLASKKTELEIMAGIGRAKKEGVQHENNFYSIMRLEEGTELFKAIWADEQQIVKKPKISYTDRLTIALKAAYDVNFLHQHNIIHGDIKHKNLMFSNNSSEILGSQITVANVDFGFSMILPNGKTYIHSSTKGTRDYMAPEVENKGEFSFASDIFALGMIYTSDLEINEKKPGNNEAPYDDMLEDSPEKRPGISEVIDRLVSELKLQPLHTLDMKAIELIDIYDNQVNSKITEENETLKKQNLPLKPLKETYKTHLINNIIKDFNFDNSPFYILKQKSNKKNPASFDFLTDNKITADQKAIALKGYLVQQLNLEENKIQKEQSSLFLNKNQKAEKLKDRTKTCHNIINMIERIDKVSRGASFYGHAGCKEYYQMISTKKSKRQNNTFESLFNYSKALSSFSKTKPLESQSKKTSNKFKQ